MPAQVAAAPAGAAGPAAGAAGGQPAQQQQQSPFMSMIRMMMFWYFLSNFLFKKPASKEAQVTMRNLFTKGEEIDMWVYLSDKPVFTDFTDESSLVWYEAGLPYATYVPEARRSLEYTYFPTKAVQNNGSLFAHMFFARSGYSPDPSDPSYVRTSTFSRTHPLVVYYKRPKEDKRKSLVQTGDKPAKKSLLGLGESQEESEEKEGESGDTPKLDDWISYWKPNLTISLVDDFTVYPVNGIPQVFQPHIFYDPDLEGYYPVVFPNDFWLLKDKLIMVNETISNLTLSMVVETLPAWRWQIYMSSEQSFKLQESYGATLEGEADELKRVFLEGNPILLAITLVVSVLHSVFDFLAFKNDIQFWRQNKSMEGLSARTIVLNFICQLIIFLYLLDNDTSWLILISAGISCGIEFWKIGKAMHVEVVRSGNFFKLKFADRDSYTQSKTKEYDDLAMVYLSYVLYPLVIGYAVYSLVYESHKSWYSWILSSLTGCVYTFGFIMMCPQLFINYKMKSVAHLPWRQMTYKFLNTIVDDLFAFVIKMPTLHRLSVFRDDIVFLFLLYQRWIYPVDKERVNEFGYAAVDPAAEETSRLTEGEGTPAEALPSAEGAAASVAEGDAEKKDETATKLESKGDTSRNVSEEGLTKRKGKGGKGGSS